jgi:hypothetical protein
MAHSLSDHEGDSPRPTARAIGWEILYHDPGMKKAGKNKAGSPEAAGVRLVFRRIARSGIEVRA